MSSQLRAIYAAIAGMPVRYNSAIVTAYDLAALPNQVPATNLPVRLLLPLESRGEGRGVNYVSLGTPAVVTVDWKLVDLMLALPISQGSGIQDVAPLLVDYKAEYLEHVRNNKRIAHVANITSVAMEMAAFTYPASSRTAYFGVEVTLTIKEIVG